MANQLIHADLLRLLHYDPESGIFTWRVARNSHGGKVKPGVRAGQVISNGQSQWREVGVLRRTYKEHRLAWFYVHGRWPTDQIDHINRDPLDNRLVNLREATGSQNSANTVKRKPPKSGYRGVYRDKGRDHGRWFAQIGIHGKSKCLGTYDTPEEAHEAYCRAARELHGEFTPV